MYVPVLELTRGKIVESIHFGAVAVVDSNGVLLASLGDPYLVSYLRSSSKPLQALSFIERGGDQAFHLTSKEVALICASHEGSEEHVEVVKTIQSKAGILESDLLCGSHRPFHVPTQQALVSRGEEASPNYNNCSGKHTGMLAFARMLGMSISDYINPEHPIQKIILASVAEMCGLKIDQVDIGIDGCSAPNYAMPLFNAALGFARLCDGRRLGSERAAACKRICSAMMANPTMVSGKGRFDTRLMETCEGRIVAKGGAEGYYCLGMMAGATGADSPGVGVAVKIADGDISLRKADGEMYNRVRPSVVLEILRQMDYINQKEWDKLSSDFGSNKQLCNLRNLVTGESRTVFTLQKKEETK